MQQRYPILCSITIYQTINDFYLLHSPFCQHRQLHTQSLVLVYGKIPWDILFRSEYLDDLGFQEGLSCGFGIVNGRIFLSFRA